MVKITFRNDFHNTSANIMISEKGTTLTTRQMGKLKKLLCMRNCECGIVRGRQTLPPNWQWRWVGNSIYVGPKIQEVSVTSILPFRRKQVS